MRCCEVCPCGCVSERDHRSGSWTNSRDAQALQRSVKQNRGGLSSCPAARFGCTFGPWVWVLSCRVSAREPAEGLRPAACRHQTCCATIDTAAVFQGVRLSMRLSVHLNETRADLSTANIKMLSKSTEKGSLEMNHEREKRCFEYRPFSLLTTLSSFSKPVLNFFAVFRLTCSIQCLGCHRAPGKITVWNCTSIWVWGFFACWGGVKEREERT